MKKVMGILAVVGLAASANAAITIVGSSVAFVDISGTGTSVGTIADDSEHTIAGATHGWGGNGLLAGGMSIRIGNNGAVIWGTSATDTFTGATEIGYYNAAPLNSTTPAGSQTSIATMVGTNTTSSGNGGGIRQFIMPLWDDYVPVSGGTTTSVKWQVIGSDLIIQWNREDAFAATGAGDVTFEAIFHGGVAIGAGSLVDFVYNDTLFAASQYQDDGGSATIGFKNWGLNGAANDVEFGVGGGGTSSTSDPTFASGTGMAPKVTGWVANNGGTGPHSVSIIPTPGSLALLGLAGLAANRRRR